MQQTESLLESMDSPGIRLIIELEDERRRRVGIAAERVVVQLAGLHRIEVHGITISREQHRFGADKFKELALPCCVEEIDLFDFRPDDPFDAVVLVGSPKHLPNYRSVVRVASRVLVSGGWIYADFCSRVEGFHLGEFMSRYIWPGSARYVDLPALLTNFGLERIYTVDLEEDSSSYALTVRDWAQELEAVEDQLTALYGRESVRAFLLYLWSAHQFLRTGRTQAYRWIGRHGDLADVERAC
jgi:cyclopropane-fatty-acyl-phospholipid synthase